MNTLEYVLYGICVLYALEYVVFFLGSRRIHQLPHQAPDVWPEISVLVAARNEEENIGACIASLLEQDYPQERIEILIINDESEDRTLEIAQAYEREAGEKLRVFTTIPEESHAKGKARAIAQGIDHATGEIILLTDADCIAPKTWARSVVEHFRPEVDVYGGFTLVRDTGLFSGLQQLDWIHLHTLASDSMAFNSPIGVIGNNFAFRRKAYEDVGGYRKVRFTVTEDFALFMAMHRAGKKIIFPCTHGTRMVTLPCKTMGDVIRQKQRWGRGGLESSLHGYSVLVVAFFMLVAFSITPFVSPITWLVVWSTKFAADLLLMTPSLARLGKLRSLRYFPVFEFYFILQAVVVPILLINRNVVWKGRTFRS